MTNVIELNKRSEQERVKDFSEIVDRIESLDDKKKILYKEIYENAITDRKNAYMMFSRLIEICQNNTTEHAVHGRTISAYIERMSKANDQLIKLVEAIRRAEEESETIDSEEMFNKIGGR